MGRRFGFPLLFGLFVLAMLAGVGVYTYNLGVAHGLTVAAPAAAPGGAAPMVFYPRPWGFGFGFFPLMILFWIFVIRGLFWRGRWGGGCGYGSRYGGVPPAFDEWHRRAHAQEPRQPQANV